MVDSLKGRWERLMFDIENVSANVAMDVDDRGTGSFEFVLVGEDKPGQPRRGELHSKLSGDGRVSMETMGGDLPPITFEGQVFSVKVHARAAIAGTYRGADIRDGLERGGVAIFWLYGDQK